MNNGAPPALAMGSAPGYRVLVWLGLALVSGWNLCHAEEGFRIEDHDDLWEHRFEARVPDGKRPEGGLALEDLARPFHPATAPPVSRVSRKSSPGPIGSGTVSRARAVQQLYYDHGTYLYGPGADEIGANTVLQAVSQFDREDVKGLYIHATDELRQYGVMGYYWVESAAVGRIVLFNSRIFHVALHEVAHHLTISKRRDISREIFRIVAPYGNGSIRWENVPSEYALRNPYEYLAEWVANVREIEAGIPPHPNFRSPIFKPDPAAVEVTRPLYASPAEL